MTVAAHFPTTTAPRTHPQDEFLLNGKPTTARDIRNLLEAAGFSRSNPYYFVPQGKVNQLALMTNLQRLQLLKEVAGAKVGGGGGS